MDGTKEWIEGYFGLEGVSKRLVMNGLDGGENEGLLEVEEWEGEEGDPYPKLSFELLWEDMVVGVERDRWDEI